MASRATVDLTDDDTAEARMKGACLVDLTDDASDLSPSPVEAASSSSGAHNTTAANEALARRLAAEDEALARRLAAEEEDEALAKRLAEECELCQAAPANPGFSWCTACFEATRRPDVGSSSAGSSCSRCAARPPNPGYDTCSACFRTSRRSGEAPCSLCHVAAANPGYDWCTGCYLSQRHTGFGAGIGGGFGGGGFGGGGFGFGGRFGGGNTGSAPPENATYEELLAWEEARGTAGPPKGMSGQQLSALPRRSFLGPTDALKGEEAACAICMCDYEKGESLCILSCLHTFHVDCVGTWLKDKPSCPICMRDVKQDMR